ncbi:hypothetical protein ONV78_28945 [Hahella sp. CR1]|uniref:hypothetical protein n=1 Tax=Hahella sp. CR1 TaxID=2992807 RepID=UPI00244287F0|nr:hypothetical protein [Hahella sp. CR1]MDG9671798.1 hypothetical protein [Hahella sp. CR1]
MATDITQKDFEILAMLRLRLNPGNCSFYHELYNSCRNIEILQPSHNHYYQWKKFIRKIGKRLVLIGLLDIAPLALHQARSPLPLHMQKYALSPGELERLEMIVKFLNEWVQSGDEKIKIKLRLFLPEREPYSFGGITTAPTHYINWLLLILVGKKKFTYYTNRAMHTAMSLGLQTNSIDWCVEEKIANEILAKYA